MTVLPTSPRPIGQVLDAGIRLGTRCYRRALPLSALLGVLFMVMSLLPVLLIGTSPDPESPTTVLIALGVMLATMPFQLWVWFAITVVARAADRGESLGAWRAIGIVGRRLHKLIGATLLYVLVVLGSSLLLIVPGILFGLSTMLASYRVLFAGQGAFAAIRGSHRLVWGNWWRTAVLLTVMATVYYIASMCVVIPAVVVELWLLGESGQGIITNLFSLLATAVLAPYWAATFYALYSDLVLRKEGTDLAVRIERLAAQPA